MKGMDGRLHHVARWAFDSTGSRYRTFAPVGDGTILPFTHVDCERVRTFLQTTLLGYRPQDRERAYGRALGRVLAHELYHVYGDTPQHTARGVAKENYSVADLLAADFRFHEKETRAFGSSKTLAALKAAGEPE